MNGDESAWSGKNGRLFQAVQEQNEIKRGGYRKKTIFHVGANAARDNARTKPHKDKFEGLRIEVEKNFAFLVTLQRCGVGKERREKGVRLAISECGESGLKGPTIHTESYDVTRGRIQQMANAIPMAAFFARTLHVFLKIGSWTMPCATVLTV